MGKKVEIEIKRDVEASYSRPTTTTRGLLGSTETTEATGQAPDANPILTFLGILFVIIIVALILAGVASGYSEHQRSSSIPHRSPHCTASRSALLQNQPVETPRPREPEPAIDRAPPRPVIAAYVPPIQHDRIDEPRMPEPVHPTALSPAEKVEDVLRRLEPVLSRFSASEASLWRQAIRLILTGEEFVSPAREAESLRQMLERELRNSPDARRHSA